MLKINDRITWKISFLFLLLLFFSLPNCHSDSKTGGKSAADPQKNEIPLAPYMESLPHWKNVSSKGFEDKIIFNVSFADSKKGFMICGEDRYRRSLMMTRDGGENWAPAEYLGNGILPAGIHVYDSNHACVSCYYDTNLDFFFTEDGGESWIHAPAGFWEIHSLRGFDFLGPNEALIYVEGSYSPGLGYESGSVKYTENGRSWHDISGLNACYQDKDHYYINWYCGAWNGYKKGEEDFPATRVSFEDAKAYAAWAGKRLPTEAEWEKGARGSDGRIFPWGNSWEPRRCNFADFDAYRQETNFELKPTGSFPGGASPHGLMDMLGNAAEWVDTSAAGESRKIIKGYIEAARHPDGMTYINGRCSSRKPDVPEARSSSVGFRCAASEKDLKSSANMIHVKKGEFLSGDKGEEIPISKTLRIGADNSSIAQEKKYLEGYYIDKYEVTNSEFEKFVKATGYKLSNLFRAKGLTQAPPRPGQEILASYYLDDDNMWFMVKSGEKASLIYSGDGGRKFESLFEGNRDQMLAGAFLNYSFITDSNADFNCTKKLLFLDKNRGWLFTPAVLLSTRDGGRNWTPEVRIKLKEEFLSDPGGFLRKPESVKELHYLMDFCILNDREIWVSGDHGLLLKLQ